MQLSRASIRENLIFLDPSIPLFDALNKFQTGKSHIAFVRDESKLYGIITIEDILETILQNPIYDEMD